MSGTSSTTLAITGLACRYPGAPDAQAYWRLLLDGREGVTRFTDDELAARGVTAALRRNPSYVPVGGVVDGQDEFDPEPFGLTDGEAALLDPQQRLFLECCWHALEQAGHACGRDAGAVGVFAGSAHSSYLISNLAHRYDPTYSCDPAGSLQVAMGSVIDYLPLQVAYRLNLTGPAMAVQTTCSTSLVAVHQAAQSLLTGECDTAVAGGVSLTIPQGRGYVYAPDGPFSADGHTRPFSAEATGIVFTQGVGVVVLRRLADALADGDPVLAMLLGSAVNNDGATKVGFAAPSAGGQARVIAEALAVAGVDARSIGYVEAHGTGTKLGDPIEVEALRRVFGPADEPWCGLGSAKGNIGHTNAAAGVAGLIKAVLAVGRGVLPASINSEPLNPQLSLSASPFAVVAQTAPWAELNAPRRAGVSSFGIGGTNCHVILEQPPTRPRQACDGRSQLLIASASTEAACRRAASVLIDVPADTDLADVAYTLQVGRAPFEHRVAAAIKPGAEPIAVLRSQAPVRTPARPPRVVFAFPGGGAQYAGMGAGLYREEPVFAASVDECARLFESLLGLDVRVLLHAQPGDPRVRDARYALPALFAVSLATARLLDSWGVAPDLVLGHSLGEYVAAVVSRVLPTADAAALVAVRSQGMADAGAGAMLSVPLAERAVRELLAGEFSGIDLAVVNAPDACVVSGPRSLVIRLRDELTSRGLEARLLRLDAGAHSRLIEPAMPAMRAAAAHLAPGPPQIPLVTTLTGMRVADELTDPEHWVRHLRGTVWFSAALRTALDADAIFVQVGPGTALASLARRHRLDTLRAVLTTLPSSDDAGSDGGADDRAVLLDTVGQLWAHGVSVDFGALHLAGRRRVALPGYPFQHRRLWIDPAPQEVATDPSNVDEPLQVPVWRQLPPRTSAPGTLQGQAWLVVGPDRWSTGAVGAALRAAGASVGTVGDGADATGVNTDGPLTGVVSLIGARAGSDPTQHVADAVVGYADLARLLHRLDPAARPTRLLQVTCGGERIERAESLDPAVATLRALPRVLAHELQGLHWCALDLPAGAIDATVVAAEASDDVSDLDAAEIAVRGGVRWVHEWTSWQPVRLDRGVCFATPPVVLITGGLGHIGLRIAEHLADRYHAKLVLSSRNGLAAPSENGTVDNDTADTVHRSARVRELRERGHVVKVHAVDAADVPATAELVRATVVEHGRLDLVVHAAGMVGFDQLVPLTELDAGDVAANVAAKVSGALSLNAALEQLEPGTQPVAVVLIASIASGIGGLGLAGYAAANRFLDAFAADRDASPDGPRWVSIAWDRWRLGKDVETGSAVAEFMRHALEPASALDALDRLLELTVAGGAPAAVAVSPSALGPRAAALPDARTVRHSELSGSALAGAGSPLQSAAERTIAALWSELLGVPVTDRDADFFALGGHSLVATRMLAALRDQHGVELRLRDVLVRPTVAGLAELLGDIDRGDIDRGDIDRGEAPAAALPPMPDALAHGDLDRGDAPAPPAVFPLTRVQHAYWIGRSGAYELGEVGCHFYLEHDCPTLDLERYQWAWNRLIARHDMLRAVVRTDGRNVVLADVPEYRIRVRDLRALRADDATARLARLRERLSRRVARPDCWPLLEIQAVRLPAGSVRLLVSVDVLVCDWASYLVLDSELRQLYEDPTVVLEPLGMTFADCVRALEDRRAGEEFARAADYWRQRLPALPGAPALPVQPRREGQRPRFGRRRTELEPAAWQRLRDTAAELGATPTAVLLAAYADVLAVWSNSAHFAITLTLFDRPRAHADVDRVVGDFTELILHEIDLTTPASFADRVHAVQRRLFDDLDHRQFTALDVLDERAARTGQRGNIPVVFTSALGLEHLNPHDMEWVGRIVEGVSQTPQVWLDHQVFLLHDTLQLQWDVLETVLPAAEADAAFAGYAAWVTRLATDTAAWHDPSAGPRLPIDDAAVTLRTGTGAQPLFLVHPSGGDVLCYAELARRLHGEHPVIALQDPELSGIQLPADLPIAALARRYVQVLRAHQPAGPYLLGGWSMGGTVAHQMACELDRAGEHVGLLVMIDANTPERIVKIEGLSQDDSDAELWLRYLRSLEAYFSMDLGTERAGARAPLAALSAPARRDDVADRLRRNGLLGGANDTDVLDVRMAVFRRHLRSLAEHRADDLTADACTEVLLLRAVRPSPRNAQIGMGVDDASELPDLGWAPHVAGRLTVAEIDAHHYLLLREPAVGRVADLISTALARAGTRLAGSGIGHLEER